MTDEFDKLVWRPVTLLGKVTFAAFLAVSFALFLILSFWWWLLVTALAAVAFFYLFFGIYYVFGRLDTVGDVYLEHVPTGLWKHYPPDSLPPAIFGGEHVWKLRVFKYEWREYREDYQTTLWKQGRVILKFSWRPNLAKLNEYFNVPKERHPLEWHKHRVCTLFSDVWRKKGSDERAELLGRTLIFPAEPGPDDTIEVKDYAATLTEPIVYAVKMAALEGEHEGLHIGDDGGAPVHLDDEDRITHVQIIGASRFGKSKLVEHAVRQLIGKAGVVVLDPNEQLYEDITAWCAHKHMGGVRFLDATDEGSEVGFSPFLMREGKTHDRIYARASRILKTMLKAGKFQGDGAVLAERIMRVLLYVTIEQDLPVTALQSFTTPRLFAERDEIMARCASEEMRDEWEMLTAGKKDNAYVSMMQSSATRLVKVLLEPPVKRILEAPIHLDLREIVERGESLIINLKDTPDRLSPEARDILGTFITDELWSIIKGRSRQDAKRLPGLNLVIDEFHNFATPEFAMMLKEGGKYGLHMWLINHALDDLDRDVQNALKACHTRIAFGGTSRKDAATVLEGSTPGKNRDLRDEIDSVPGLKKRRFILRRTGKRNLYCTTADVEEYGLGLLGRSYLEDLMRRPFLERLDALYPMPQTLSSGDEIADTSAPNVTPTPLKPDAVEPDDFYH